MSVAGPAGVQPFFNNVDLKSHLKNNDLFLVKESLASLSLSRHIVIHHNSLLTPGEMLLTLLPTSVSFSLTRSTVLSLRLGGFWPSALPKLCLASTTGRRVPGPSRRRGGRFGSESRCWSVTRVQTTGRNVRGGPGTFCTAPRPATMSRPLNSRR